MKIIVIGGTGTIGQAVVKELQQRHEVIIAAHTRGAVTVDITDQQSIRAMFKKIGKIDALISTTGHVHFEKLSALTPEKYQIGLTSKLMGQVNLVHIGMEYLADDGSFTLTSGMLNHDPIAAGTAAAMVNGGLEGFVKSAAIEMPKKMRINLVSPTVLAESMSEFADFFRGFDPVPAATVALAYSKSVEGAQTGQIYRVGYSC